MEGKLSSAAQTGRSIEEEIKLTKVLILFTLIASVFATVDVGGILLQHARSGSIGAALEQSLFIFIVAFLVYGNLVYQFTRLGYLKRKAGHRPAGIDELRSVFKRSGRGLTVLVPSYKEEPNVIAQTLWSAALVRPRGYFIGTVEVRVRVYHSPVAEGNCVVARRGGE